MSLEFVWSETVKELWYLVRAPLIVPELWWIITPLIVTLLVMTFYFGKYHREELGWNTALTNSIVLIFVGIDLLRTVYHYSTPPSFWNLLLHPVTVVIIFFVMLEGYYLAKAAFAHAVPRKIMFLVASPLSINLQAYVLAVFVYGSTDPNVYMVLGALLLFAILFAILRTIQEIQHLYLGYHKKDFENVKKRITRKASKPKRKKK